MLLYNNRVGRELGSTVFIMIIERMNMYRKNEIIELNITSLTSDGDGVGVKTPADRPKNVTEAGKLAKLLF